MKTHGPIASHEPVAVVWRTSSRSGNAGGSNCVEVGATADESGQVLVRDSKNRDGGFLAFSADEWGRFTSTLRTGSFDLPA